MQHQGRVEDRLSQLLDESNKMQLKEYMPHEELWRFFHDKETQTGNKNLPFIFHSIFNSKQDLSFEMILKMNQTMKDYLHSNELPGNHDLRLNMMGKTILNKNTTQIGMRELLREFTPDMAFMINGMFIHKLTLERLLRSKNIKGSKEFAIAYPSLYHELLESVSDRLRIAEVLYKMTRTEGIIVAHCSVEDKRTDKQLQDYASRYIENFNTEITTEGMSPLDKLSCIIRFVQQLMRLNMFDKTNTATLAVLLYQHLLVKHLSVLSIMENPENFYGHSVNELVHSTLYGIEHVIAIIDKRVSFSRQSAEMMVLLEEADNLGVNREIFNQPSPKTKPHHMRLFKVNSQHQRNELAANMGVVKPAR